MAKKFSARWKAGDFMCRACPDNGRAANKQFAYFWESEVTNSENAGAHATAPQKPEIKE